MPGLSEATRRGLMHYSSLHYANRVRGESRIRTGVDDSEHQESSGSPYRTVAAKVFNSRDFELSMGVIIMLNVAFMIFEVDMDAQCYPAYAHKLKECPFKSEDVPWVAGVQFGFMVLYTAELVVQAYVLRWNLFRDHWLLLDGFVVLVAWFSSAFDGAINLNFLRSLRIFRLAKAYRVLESVRELHLLVRSIISSMKAIFFGTVLIFATLTGIGILMVSIAHPTISQIKWNDCPECKLAFRSVGHAVMTLFKELVAGGSWLISAALLERDFLSLSLMIITTIVISLGLLNLILTVIVERAAEATANSNKQEVVKKLFNQHEAKQSLIKLCEQLDKDGRGRIRLQELLDAGLHSDVFRDFLHVMELTLPELKAIFQIVDRCGEGELPYQSFCDELFHMKTQDQHMLLSMVRLSAQDIHLLIQDAVVPRLEKLAKQFEMHFEQFAIVENKIGQLTCQMQGGASSHAAQVHGSLPREVCTDDDFDHITRLHSPQHSNSRRDGTLNQRSTNLSACPTAEFQGWKYIDQLQKEMQLFVDLEAHLTKQATFQVDTSLPSLTKSLQKLVSDGFQKCSEETKTLEVRLAERKFQMCKSAIGALPIIEGRRATGRVSQSWQDLPLETADMETIVCTHEEVLSQLKGLLPQLLPLSKNTVPKQAAASPLPRQSTEQPQCTTYDPEPQWTP